MNADQLEFGQVIAYRGRPAQVVDCWTSLEDAPRSFADKPCGCVIEWTEDGDEDELELHRCRLLFEDPEDQTTDGLNDEPLALRGE